MDLTGKLIVSSDINAGSLNAGSVNGTAAGTAWSDTDGLGSTDNQKLGSYNASSATSPSAATAANVPTRVPQHEPWLGHENLNPAAFTPDNTDGSVEEEQQAVPAKTPDTFRQNVQRESGSQPATSTPEQQQQEAAATEEPDDGVTQTPESAASAVPTEVAESASAVKENMNPGSVSGLINSVADAATNITHSVGQAIVGTIDSIAGPGALKNIASVGGEIISDVSAAATSLLGLRTTLAKGETPRPVPTRSGPGNLGTAEDREIIASVGSGTIPAGETVTMSDGTQLIVVEDESGNRSLAPV